MDVTPQILDFHRIYGSSDNTAPHQTSSSKVLNYANGATLQKPDLQSLTKIPFEFKYQDTVGLFGAENYFVRIDLKVIDTGTDNIVINTYEEAMLSAESSATVRTFEPAIIDDNADPTTVNTYDPALITYGNLPNYLNSRISVELINHKTGNQYIDSWLDVRLYTKNKEEWEYDKMYLNLFDYFYIGFHARNTRRLPYNVSCKIGEEYVDFNFLTPAQKKLTPNL